MTFATIANLLTTILCVAVLVQSQRVKRALDTIRHGELGQVVAALDQSTLQARIVLSELKGTLSYGSGQAAAAVEGKAVLDELRMMIDIADATAERLVTAAAAGRQGDLADLVEEAAL
ncbi:MULTISPECIES: hypothetical protein [unclassified Sphingomonas]|uniref:hypothetical protein n=1 Tax=unclassified Sphingomonas TaxID=196159 RepID=UPI001F5AB7B2|nr:MULTISPECIES: hypothetical protein [unclassified Sphingomonas]